MLLGELCGQLQHAASVAAALHVIAHGNAAKHRDVVMNVDTNGADGDRTVPQDERVVIRPMFVGMVRVVRPPASAKLEQNSAANGVIRGPFGRGAGSAKFDLHVRR